MRPLVFVKYAAECSRRRGEQELFRVYVSEQMRLRGEGKYLPPKYYDLLHPAEEFSASDVIDSVIEKAGLEVISE